MLIDVYLNITIAKEPLIHQNIGHGVLAKSIELSNDRGFAMMVEKAIKRLKSRIIIQKIILEIEKVEALAQLVRVPMHRD